LPRGNIVKRVDHGRRVGRGRHHLRRLAWLWNLAITRIRRRWQIDQSGLCNSLHHIPRQLLAAVNRRGAAGWSGR
jgi:hypothetical protein